MTPWKPKRRTLLIAVASVGVLTAAAARFVATLQTAQAAHVEHALIHNQDPVAPAAPGSAISLEAAEKLKAAFATRAASEAKLSHESIGAGGPLDPDHTGTISEAPAPNAAGPDRSFQASPLGIGRLELDRLIAKGEAILRASDLATARLYFRRAAEAGDMRGALGMARSFDSEVLKELRLFGVRADASQAQEWYARARKLRHSPPVDATPPDAPRLEARTSY